MTLGLVPYSARFHAMRRLLHKELTGSALSKYEPLHEQESRSLIRTVLRNPSCLQDAVRQWVHAINIYIRCARLVISHHLQLLRICYTKSDVWISDSTTRRSVPRACRKSHACLFAIKSTGRMARRHHAMAYVQHPWGTPVRPADILSLTVRHIPDWFPGAKFKRIAAQWKRLHMDMIWGPYLWAKTNQVWYFLSSFRPLV